jgi:polyhydroxyalkanoic acid synthase PhaR subunit
MDNSNFLKMWKDYYNQYSNFFDEKVKEDFPSQGVGQVLEMNLLLKKMLNETTEQYLDQVNMPTKNDIASVSSLIVNIDTKVDELEVTVDEMKSVQAHQPELQREIASLHHEVAEVRGDITEVKGEMADLKTAVTAVKSEVANSQKNIKSLDHKLNEILFLLKSQEIKTNGTNMAVTKTEKGL